MPARIVNWGGDDAVSVQEWCAFFAELTGHDVPVDVVATPGTLAGLDRRRRPHGRRSPGRAGCTGRTACAPRTRRGIRERPRHRRLVGHRRGHRDRVRGNAARPSASARGGRTAWPRCSPTFPAGRCGSSTSADLDGIDEFAATGRRGARRHRRAGEQRRRPEAAPHDDHDRRRRRERDGDQLLLAGAPHPGRAPPHDGARARRHRERVVDGRAPRGVRRGRLRGVEGGARAVHRVALRGAPRHGRPRPPGGAGHDRDRVQHAEGRQRPSAPAGSGRGHGRGGRRRDRRVRRRAISSCRTRPPATPTPRRRRPPTRTRSSPRCANGSRWLRGS